LVGLVHSGTRFIGRIALIVRLIHEHVRVKQLLHALILHIQCIGVNEVPLLQMKELKGIHVLQLDRLNYAAAITCTEEVFVYDISSAFPAIDIPKQEWMTYSELHSRTTSQST
jgi:hypothetical protein